MHVRKYDCTINVTKSTLAVPSGFSVFTSSKPFCTCGRKQEKRFFSRILTVYLNCKYNIRASYKGASSGFRLWAKSLRGQGQQLNTGCVTTHKGSWVKLFMCLIFNHDTVEFVSRARGGSKHWINILLPFLKNITEESDLENFKISYRP